MAARIEQILENPETCDRFGGLSLGESRDLVDDVRILSQLPPAVRWLVKDAKGEALPTWVDYQGSQATRWEVLTLRASSQPAFCAISPSNSEGLANRLGGPFSRGCRDRIRAQLSIEVLGTWEGRGNGECRVVLQALQTDRRLLKFNWRRRIGFPTKI